MWRIGPCAIKTAVQLNRGYVPCVCKGSVRGPWWQERLSVCFKIQTGSLLISLHDSITEQSASRPNKALTNREPQICPKFSQPDSRYSRQLRHPQDPIAALDGRRACVSSAKESQRVLEPGNSGATSHRKTDHRPEGVIPWTMSPTWNMVSGFHSLHLCRHWKPQWAPSSPVAA